MWLFRISPVPEFWSQSEFSRGLRRFWAVRGRAALHGLLLVELRGEVGCAGSHRHQEDSYRLIWSGGLCAGSVCVFKTLLILISTHCYCFWHSKYKYILHTSLWSFHACVFRTNPFTRCHDNINQRLYLAYSYHLFISSFLGMCLTLYSSIRNSLLSTLYSLLSTLYYLLCSLLSTLYSTLY